VAQTLHSVSLRATRPLVTVNTGGLAEGVFESELFGHVKGAFTDAKVDRVGASKWPTAARCSWTKSPTFHRAAIEAAAHAGDRASSSAWARRRRGAWTCASSRPPTPTWLRAVAEGRFRQDLLFRLNTIELRLPPLRDRREDIPLLAAHFLHQHAEHYRKPLGFDEGAIKALLAHAWPGNVRELDHAVERAVLMAQGDTIRAADLGLRAGREGPPRLEEMSLEEVEALLIKKALARFNGNVSHAANALG
jgi:DNA-binding NtrC family response regulator